MNITDEQHLQIRSIHILGKFVCLFYFLDFFFWAAELPEVDHTFYILHYTKIIMQTVTVIFDIYIA